MSPTAVSASVGVRIRIRISIRIRIRIRTTTRARPKALNIHESSVWSVLLSLQLDLLVEVLAR